MRQYDCISPDEDLIDYPVSEAFWRDAYRQGLTPHRPPVRTSSEDIEQLQERIEELERQLRSLGSQKQSQRTPTVIRSTSSAHYGAAPPTDDPLVDQLRQVNLADYAGRYTQLRPMGAGRWKGPCPLHTDTSRSFYVRANPWRWDCYACGRGGDIFHLAEAIQARGGS